MTKKRFLLLASGWKSGVYVVQGQTNGETVKEKILVK